MKIFISVDMEGVSCVTHGDHTKGEGLEYEMARRWATAEVNAAVDGASEAGATQFVVVDGHGRMINIIPDELREDVQLVRGIPRPMMMMDGLDENFDAVFFIGYHSMSGTGNGILSHTYSSIIFDTKLNGTTVGESGFNAAAAGHFTIPVALVSGDDALMREVQTLMPWTERVITKWGISRNSARNLIPTAAQKVIREGAKRSLTRLSEMKPLVLDSPIRFEVTFTRARYAYPASGIPGVDCIDDRTLAFTGKNMIEISQIWRLMLNVCAGDDYI